METPAQPLHVPVVAPGARRGRVSLVAFAGRGGDTPVERLVAGAQHAATLDLLDLAREEPLIGGLILATDAPELAAGLDPGAAFPALALLFGIYSLVTMPLENVLMGIPRVTTVRSKSP